MDELLNRSDVEASVAKVFGGGPLNRYPKISRDRTVFLGLAALRLRPLGDLSEPQVNAALGEWLLEMEASEAIDHVTLRRYLVDIRFLTRDANGAGYRVDAAALDRAFAPEAQVIDVQGIINGAEADRLARRQAWEDAQRS